MPILNEWEIGVMFWAGRDPSETLRELTAMGVHCGQLGIPGHLDLTGAADPWKSTAAEQNFKIYTVFAAYEGEDYADIPTVQRTIGFVPHNTRSERERRTRDVSDFAHQLGVPSIATHIGCLPDDSSDPDYLAVREMVRRVCDHAAKWNQTFALETGQETAEALRSFIIDVNRENLGINFDPANMILYGTGDPIEAVGLLGEHILTVHCKDGDWPPKNIPGALGHEKPLGEGAVNIHRFLAQLKKTGYKGPLAIERESSDPIRRLQDIASAITLLKSA